jgi:carbonic anhydrase
MKKLIQGIVEFRRKVRPRVRETFARLAQGQSPTALLVACSDSRVVPNLFASTEPGDLFVVRNVGNLVAPCGPDGRSEGGSGGAAVEFATEVLGVSDIIVCGHSDCGAMRLQTEGRDLAGLPHVASWLRHAWESARQLQAGRRMKGDLALHNHLSQINVLVQLEHLRSFPAAREKIASGRLRLHGWWFDIGAAEVLAYEEAEEAFIVIDETEAARILARLERAWKDPEG